MIQFAHDAVLYFDGPESDGSRFWSTREEVLAQDPSRVTPATVRALPEDHNFDGLPDVYTITIQLPENAREVNYVLGALTFKCELQQKVRLSMQGLLLFDFTAPNRGAKRVRAHGELVFAQRHALSSALLLDVPGAPLAAPPRAPWSLEGVLDAYAARNESLQFRQHRPPLWSYAPSVSGSVRPGFEVDLRVDVLPQSIAFRPNTADKLTIAWVHYLAFLILVFYVIDTLRTFVFSRQIVRTREVYDSKTE